MTSDPGMLQDRGKRRRRRKQSQTKPLPHTHTWGGIHSTACKFKTARKTTTDRDMAICLVNFYKDQTQLQVPRYSSYMYKVKQLDRLSLVFLHCLRVVCGAAHVSSQRTRPAIQHRLLIQSIVNVTDDSHLTLVRTRGTKRRFSQPLDKHFISPPFIICT